MKTPRHFLPWLAGLGAVTSAALLAGGYLARGARRRRYQDGGQSQRPATAEPTLERFVAGLFESHVTALAAIDGLLDSGSTAEAIGLVMSDRTAERGFSIAERMQSETQGGVQPGFISLASSLRPMAPLGSPGSGTIAGGPAVPLLERAGLGTARDLSETLQHCGAEPDEAAFIAERVKNGAVLVTLRGELTSVLQAASRTVSLEGSTEPLVEGGLFRPPEAPAGEQRAAYEPRVQPGGENATFRNRALR
jgi:hypothetical protein